MVDNNKQRQVISLDQALSKVSYELTDGTNFELTMHEVKTYLVQGHADLVTVKEFVWYMQKCKALAMNPYLGDCYLIKFSATENAGIVVSVDFKRKLAMRQPTCQGWQRGVVVQAGDGEIAYRKGIVLPGDALLGGWFSATPKGWTVPYDLEVGLAGAIKRTRNGDVTSFWKPEKQADMIGKVAESRGLTAVWGEDLQGLVIRGEVETEDIDMTPRITSGGAPVYEVKDAPEGTAKKEPTPTGKVVKCKACGKTLAEGEKHVCPKGEGTDVVLSTCGLCGETFDITKHHACRTHDEGEETNVAPGASEGAGEWDMFEVTGYKTWEDYGKYAIGKKPTTFEAWCVEEIKKGVWFHMPADLVQKLLKKFQRFYGKQLDWVGIQTAARKEPVKAQEIDAGTDPLAVQGEEDPGPGQINLDRIIPDGADEDLVEVIPIFNRLAASDRGRMIIAMTKDVTDPDSSVVHPPVPDPQTADDYDLAILKFHLVARLEAAGGDIQF